MSEPIDSFRIRAHARLFRWRWEWAGRLRIYRNRWGGRTWHFERTRPE